MQIGQAAPDEGGRAMWDTVQTETTHLSHDIPCPRCGHESHIYLPCDGDCHCAPTLLPGGVGLAAA
jgi:hypothetical protein